MAQVVLVYIQCSLYSSSSNSRETIHTYIPYHPSIYLHITTFWKKRVEGDKTWIWLLASNDGFWLFVEFDQRTNHNHNLEQQLNGNNEIKDIEISSEIRAICYNRSNAKNSSVTIFIDTHTHTPIIHTISLARSNERTTTGHDDTTQ